MTDEQKKKLEHNFSYHPPKPGQPGKYGEIRGMGLTFSEIVCLHCADSRERSIALTKIEEAVMWANAAIARNE